MQCMRIGVVFLCFGCLLYQMCPILIKYTSGLKLFHNCMGYTSQVVLHVLIISTSRHKLIALFIV